MLKTAGAWIAALWVGVMVHLDWHFGRHGHDHRSLGLGAHWLLAIPAVLPVVWLASRRWPKRALSAGLLILLIGALLGQGLEPLGEIVLYGPATAPFSNGARWHGFFQFCGVGLLVLLVGAAVRSRRPPTAE